MFAEATLFLYPAKTGQWSKLLFHVCIYFLLVNVKFYYHIKRQDTPLSGLSAACMSKVLTATMFMLLTIGN